MTQQTLTHAAGQLIVAPRLDVTSMVLIEFAELEVHEDWSSHVFLQLERHMALRTDMITAVLSSIHSCYNINTFGKFVHHVFLILGEPCFRPTYPSHI